MATQVGEKYYTFLECHVAMKEGGKHFLLLKGHVATQEGEKYSSFLECLPRVPYGH